MLEKSWRKVRRQTGLRPRAQDNKLIAFEDSVYDKKTFAHIGNNGLMPTAYQKGAGWYQFSNISEMLQIWILMKDISRLTFECMQIGI
ncbi:MAG: hypothetical protein QXY52_05305 [Conexivisphaerales archaeon]